MAKGGELRALDPRGRPFGTLREFVDNPDFDRTYAVLERRPPDFDQVTDVDPLAARVYDDTWIVDCPDCGGAEFVFLEGPFLMWCHSCGNVTAAGLWRRVAMPDHRAEIEAILDKRPLRSQRNWSTETLYELELENAENGDAT